MDRSLEAQIVSIAGIVPIVVIKAELESFFQSNTRDFQIFKCAGE
jgi:hypothetical protein